MDVRKLRSSSFWAAVAVLGVLTAVPVSRALAFPTMHPPASADQAWTTCVGCHGADLDGNPAIGAPSCQACHNDFGPGTLPETGHPMPGRDDPWTNCTTCHGADLTGGPGTPSCGTCHDVPTPPNRPPVIVGDGPYEGVVGEPVNFDLSGTTDPDGDTLTFMWAWWELPDPSDPSDPGVHTAFPPPMGPTASHVYDEPGDYVAVVGLLAGPDAVDIQIQVHIAAAPEPPPPSGNGWAVQIPFLGAEFMVDFEEFAGILLVRTTYPDGSEGIAIGMEFDGVIFWMDTGGTIFFGNIDHLAGTMAGLVFDYAGASSIWIGEQM